MVRFKRAGLNPQSYLLKQRLEYEEFELIDKDSADFASLNLLITKVLSVENLSPWGRYCRLGEIY